MAQLARLMVLSLITLLFAVPAQANWLGAFWHHVVRETKRRQCWPKPFVCPDRQTVRQPFAVMVANGWRSQSMLGDHHFADEESELTEAGRRKVFWILTEAPPEHRIVYVHQSMDAGVTAARLKNTRQLVGELVVAGPQPQVIPTAVRAPGWPADEVDLVGRKFESSMPDPRVKLSNSDTSIE